MPPPDSSLQDVIDLVVIGPGSLHDTNNGANGKLQRNMPKELVVGIRAGHSPSDEGSTILDSPRNISSGKFADVRISGSPSGAIASSSAEDERAQQRERLRGCPRIPDGEVNLLCNIGEGGFCEVFEGKWFGAPVAVKRLKLTGQPERDAALAHAFEQEIGLHHSLVNLFWLHDPLLLSVWWQFSLAGLSLYAESYVCFPFLNCALFCSCRLFL